jgi:periplasmic protein TonB
MAERRAFGGNERRGFAVAVAAHVLIIGLLSVQWTAGDRRFDNPPMEVDLIAETAPQSSAPVITETPPAARLGDEYSEDIQAPEPVPTPPVPEPIVRPTPAPAPKQVARPVVEPKKTPPAAKKAAPKATPKAVAPPKKTQTRPTGRLDGIVDGLSKAPTKSTQTKGAPAATTAAEVKRSIDVAIDGKILPYWRRNVPSGIDIDQLRVVLRIQLSRDGRVTSVSQVGELSGKTDSNAPQQKLFVERAERSIRQASPFDLPDEYYDQWKVWDVTFRAKGM